jgi:lipoprotein-releasing system permease protein
MNSLHKPTKSLFELPIYFEIGFRYVRARKKNLGDKKDGFLSFIAT